MCNLSQGIREEGRWEGRIEGRIEGKIEGRKEGKVEGKIESAIEIYRDELHMSDKDILDKIIAKYNISEEEALKYLKNDTIS